MNCFLCNQPTDRVRSLNHLTAPPATPRDALPICEACDEDWFFSLLACLRSDLAFIWDAPVQDQPFNRSTNHPSH